MRNIKYELFKMQQETEKEMKKNQKHVDFEELERQKIEYYKTHEDIKPDSLSAGWFIYIFVMIGGMIFVDYIWLAIFATLYFIWWRKDQVDRANGRKYDD